MTNLRNLINENSSFEDLVVLRSQEFDFDCIDYVILSRLEARLKYAMGETDSGQVWNADSDEICIISHYSPASTKVMFAMLYHDISSDGKLSNDEISLFDRIEEAYFQYQLAKGEYDRGNPKDEQDKTKFEAKVGPKDRGCRDLLKTMKEQHPDLYKAFVQKVKTQRERVLQADRTNIALNGFIRNPDLYDVEPDLSDHDKEVVRRGKEMRMGEPYDDFDFNYRVPNPNHTKQELMQYQGELVKAIGISEPTKLAEITHNAYSMNAHGIVEQLITIFENHFMAVEK